MVQFQNQKIKEALTSCDREPIHIPGAVQEHGVLLALSPELFEVVIASENVEQYFGLPASEILEKPILDFTAEVDQARLRALLQSRDITSENPIRIAFDFGEGLLRKFDCLITRSGPYIVLDLEPATDQTDADFKAFYHLATKAIERLRSAKSAAALYQITVDETRRITGFDRVVIYQFDPKWNGHVIAESRISQADTYNDLHFPASDIPKQARDIYYRNPLRYIPAVAYAPSPLVSRHPQDAARLDLTLSPLRSVSPIHIEYLRNMKVSASMSTSIFSDDRLWGLISCSHETGSNFVSFDKRAACVFLASTLTSLLPYYENKEDYDLKDRLLEIQNSLVIKMTESERFANGLFQDPDLLCSLTGASGVAAYIDGEWQVGNQVPSLPQLEKIRDLFAVHIADGPFATNALGEFLELDTELARVASGVLGFSLSKSQTNSIFWFRPEVVVSVKWGGNPNKPVEVKDEDYILHPRKSFELWKETVRNTSAPWKKEEISAAERLRSAITDIVLQRVEQVTKLNAELERSNVELDSFAYAASHDLKEPLRGISSYVNLVQKQEAATLSALSHERLETVIRLTRRSENLINSLMDYSQLGRSDLVLEVAPLSEIVATALDSLRSMIDSTNAIFRISDLPEIRADRTQFTEVFTNLFSNAIKYNDSPQPIIEISQVSENVDPDNVTVLVKDNGIGINPKFHQTVFKIFKRLHAKTQYGGGTGTGLTIVKKIIERHGGSIVIDSEIGQGSTFAITLPRLKK